MIEAGRKSDAQTQAMAAGKANIVDVVTAVAETEVAVEALVSVRDKVIRPTKKSCGCRSDAGCHAAKRHRSRREAAIVHRFGSPPRGR